MKAVTLAAVSTLFLGTAALAAGSGPGSANNSPVQETGQTDSQYGATAPSSRAPDATTGSTTRQGMPANEMGASSGATGPKSGTGSR